MTMTIKNLSARFPKTRVKVRDRSDGGLSQGGLSRVKWGPYDTVAATLIIGANRGKKGLNRGPGFCATQPKKFKQKTLDERVQGLRIMSLLDRGVPAKKAEKMFAASRVAQRGWFKGQPEESSAFMIIHDPGVPGEKTIEDFRSSMRRLAEMASGALCQDEVILSFESPQGKNAEGVAPDRAHRKAAALRFGKPKR